MRSCNPRAKQWNLGERCKGTNDRERSFGILSSWMCFFLTIQLTNIFISYLWKRKIIFKSNLENARMHSSQEGSWSFWSFPIPESSVYRKYVCSFHCFHYFFQTIEASSIPKQKWHFFGPRLVSPICVVGDEPLASSNRFGTGQMDNTTCTNFPILGRGWDSYPPVTPPKFNRNSPWKVTGPKNPQNGKDLLFQQSFLQGWAVELQVCRWDVRGMYLDVPGS